MIEQTFLSPRVKGNVINLYVRVALQVAERLKTWEFKKLGNIRKISKVYRLSAQSFSRNENFVSTNRNLLKSKVELFP